MNKLLVVLILSGILHLSASSLIACEEGNAAISANPGTATNGIYDCVIEGVNPVNGTDSGIDVYGDITVRNCVIRDTGGCGLNIWRGNATIENNKFIDVGTRAVAIYNRDAQGNSLSMANKPVVKDNIIWNTATSNNCSTISGITTVFPFW